jgi:hypothetical protein
MKSDQPLYKFYVTLYSLVATTYAQSGLTLRTLYFTTSLFMHSAWYNKQWLFPIKHSPSRPSKGSRLFSVRYELDLYMRCKSALFFKLDVSYYGLVRYKCHVVWWVPALRRTNILSLRPRDIYREDGSNIFPQTLVGISRLNGMQRQRQYVPPKRWYPSTRLHGVITWKSIT